MAIHSEANVQAACVEGVAAKPSPQRIRLAGATVLQGDCLDWIPKLPDRCVDVVVTSPPYWGQRESMGVGTEKDPREYVAFLVDVFRALLPKLKEQAVLWINLGDAYNTPVNWGAKDHRYSSLGPDRNGFAPDNAAYTKPRFKRRAFIDRDVPWLQYGNLLMLPQRLLVALTDVGYLFRGEVIWAKKNAMPEGRCRRPHRKHESIYLLAKSERHAFRTSPPVPSVWTFANESIAGLQHRSRFPVELPRRCIDAYGQQGDDVLVLDPFSGSGTTGLAALQFGCNYIGFEIDAAQAVAAKQRLEQAAKQAGLCLSDGRVGDGQSTETVRSGHLDL